MVHHQPDQASHEPLNVWVNLTARRALFLILSLTLGSLGALALAEITANPLLYRPLTATLPLPLAMLAIGIAGLRALSRVLFRPALQVDAHGIHLLPAWPLPRSLGRVLTWEQLDHLEAASMTICLVIPWRFDHLWLIPKPGVLVESSTWESLLAVFLLGTDPDEGYRIGISSGWSHPLEAVVAHARRYRPDLTLADARPYP